jgi:hypothetical protein
MYHLTDTGIAMHDSVCWMDILVFFCHLVDAVFKNIPNFVSQFNSAPHLIEFS